MKLWHFMLIGGTVAYLINMLLKIYTGNERQKEAEIESLEKRIEQLERKENF